VLTRSNEIDETSCKQTALVGLVPHRELFMKKINWVAFEHAVARVWASSATVVIALIATSSAIVGCGAGIDANSQETSEDVGSASQELAPFADASRFGCASSQTHIYLNSIRSFGCYANTTSDGDMACRGFPLSGTRWGVRRVMDNNVDTGRIALVDRDDSTKRYVSANNGGGSSIHANRNALGPWETFWPEHQPGGSGSFYSLKTVDGGHYVTAESGGNDVMNANRTGVGAWETFDVVCN
jgi:hypothetical protein